MRKYIYSRDGVTLLDQVDAEPRCGEDFCEDCGECLHCCGEDDCSTSDDGYHIWIEYRDADKNAVEVM